MESGDRLLQIIDLYNVILMRQIEQSSSAKIDYGETLELFKECIDTLKQRGPHVDVDWFWQYLSRLRTHGTFESSEIGEEVLEDFHKLRIDPPQFVKNCISEVSMRERYIKSLFGEKKYIWNESKIHGFDAELARELQTNCFDNNSQVEYIQGLFKETVALIKEVETKIFKDYTYQIDFYKGFEFVATADHINEYFFYCESVTRSSSTFSDLFLYLTKYINNKNKLKELKRWIDEVSTLREAKRILAAPQVVDKEIYIDEKVIQPLLNVLSPAITDKAQLLEVLRGNTSKNTVLFEGSARDLVELFGYLHLKGALSSISKDSLTTWLCKHFQSKEKNRAKSLSITTVRKYLNPLQYNPPLRFAQITDILK